MNNPNQMHFLKILPTLRIMDKEKISSWSVSDYSLINQLRQKKTLFSQKIPRVPKRREEFSLYCFNSTFSDL